MSAVRRRDRLDRYHAKRDFGITAEPRGGVGPPAGTSRFVVQRHRARRLHYDLRLEMDGVLASWAVPKGPTLDPSARRMAVHVEDHPLEYFDFEGVIPAEQYGAGDVIVWDWGTWSHPDGDAVRAVEQGSLHFDLFGEKLRGRFVLVRRGRPSDRGEREQWLLLHKRDDAAIDGWDPEHHPRSVKSGRTNDEVRDAPAASWTSDSLWVASDAVQLAALDAVPTGGRWDFGGRQLRMAGLDDVVLGPSGRARGPLRRRDLVRHVALVAPAMLPYLVDRVAQIGAAGRRPPSWIHKTPGGLVLDQPAALVWAVNRGAVQIELRGGTVQHPTRPSWMWFVLDPPSTVERSELLAVASLHRAAFEHLGLHTMPVVTGTGGVEVWMPIAQQRTEREAAEWARRMTAAIAATMPDAGRWLGRPTSPGAIAVPFGVRDAPGGPVSVPVTWDELLADDTTLDGWSVVDAHARLQSAGDPLAPLIGLPQVMPTW